MTGAARECKAIDERLAGRTILVCAVYLAAHALSAWLGTHFQIDVGVRIRLTPGIALAFLVLCGPRFWPVVLAASLFTRFTILDDPYAFWRQLCLAGIFAFSNAAVAWPVRRILGPVPVPGKWREAFILLLGSFAAPLPSAVLPTLLLLIGKHFDLHEVSKELAFRWLSGVASILTIGPLVAVHVASRILGRSRTARRAWDRTDWIEAAVQSAAVLVSIWLIHVWTPRRMIDAFFLSLMPLAWISLRRGLRGATLATLAINLGSFLALLGTGPLAPIAGHYIIFTLILAGVGLALGTAVSFREEAESALAASEAFFSRVLSGAQLGLWECELPSRKLTLNDTWSNIVGYRLDSIAPTVEWLRSLVHEDDRDSMVRQFDEHIEGRSAFYEAEYRLRTQDGGWKWVHARGSVVARDAAGQPIRVSGTLVDLTDRKRAESEKSRLLEIIEAAPDFIATLDLNRHVLYANPALLRLRGLSGVAVARQRTLAEFHAPAWAEKHLDAAVVSALEQGIWIGESALIDAAGREVPVSELILVQRDDVGRPAFFSVIARDISDQKRAEAERLETERKMLQAQKLESLGVLSGGIAHDFNNLLTAMLGNASLAAIDLPVGSLAAGHLEQIQTAAVRAAELCKQLLAYSGKGQFSPTLVNLSALVEDTTHLLQLSISKKCILKFDLHRDLPAVCADATQLRQIVMNLVINASDAIGERSGLVRVATGLMRAEPGYWDGAYLTSELAPGDYIWLEVSDNGCGMSAEVKARIFEPFFTTKFAGRGLGLAAVLGIVRGHRGALKVYSEIGRGSTFKLLLPAAEGEAQVPVLHRETRQLHSATGHILVVDDEETVRVVAARILESHGFRTTLAADGREAMDLFRAGAGPFSAVLLDLTMPHMDGEETFRELRLIDPKLPILIMSGFSELDSVDRFSGRALAGFIPKPFDRETLVAKLRAVLRG